MNEALVDIVLLSTGASDRKVSSTVSFLNTQETLFSLSWSWFDLERCCLDSDLDCVDHSFRFGLARTVSVWCHDTKTVCLDSDLDRVDHSFRLGLGLARTVSVWCQIGRASCRERV